MITRPAFLCSVEVIKDRQLRADDFLICRQRATKTEEINRRRLDLFEKRHTKVDDPLMEK